MTDETDLVLDYDLDAPPEKVRRAVTIPEFREQWLPTEDLADPTPVERGARVSYDMKEEAPWPDSRVSFEISPNERGGTRLRVVHRMTRTPTEVANTNGPGLKMAA
ncbi:SRPBCC family protein [Roseobacter sinensis]|uniref:Polyketide cyclase n=1 Tax=Roseobacter sinensis TaxID=2931391 RepID=A0ABT3BBR9_9RHOB|nr:hypothetical protein [Roseobacter sp. WL0113]MCV3271000.1 hypothetical protein [Roseobacter sp. WL0113]